MFDKGDVVLYGTSGICEIDDISTLDMEGIKKDRLYYILHPKNYEGKIYVAVDRAASEMRKIITGKEAMELIEKMPEIEPLSAENDKTLEETYKRTLKKFDCVEWVRLIKYIYSRKKDRLENGKKITAVDEKYMRFTEEMLYQEIGEALDIPPDEVLEYILKKLEVNRR